MSSNKRMRSLACTLLKLLPVAGAVLLGGCDWAVLDSKGQIGMEERAIIATATWLMLIIVVPVIAMIGAFAWKYRASNARAQYSPDWDYSRAIAVPMVLVPTAIVICLSVIAWRSSHALDPYRPISSDVKPITIEVVALDWKWLFIYPDQQLATVNEIAFPTDVPVNFRITSASVMNSFFIPQLGGQIYAMSGMQTQLRLIANQEGTFDGISANYSGGGFSDMKFKAIATTKNAFDEWTHRVKGSPEVLDAAAYEALAKPSERNDVEYFSMVDKELFNQILTSPGLDPASVSTAGTKLLALKE
ncbi:MAG: ubiquinol oxidase subunit II [Steroidobacteraceae bacterium]